MEVKRLRKTPRHMKAVVNLDIRNSLPNSIDKLQLAASEINKLSFDAPITFSGLAKVGL